MNYAYRFDSSLVKTIPIVWQQNNALLWPDIAAESSTVLLKLDVRNKIGKIKQPCLKITSNNYISRQYIEHKNNGIRYFNVTDMLNQIQPGEKISLSSKQLKWHKDNAELLIFHNDIKPDAKILVIAPHADDAEIAAFGLYSTHDSYIITITAGEGSDIDYCKDYSQYPTEQRLMKAKLRILDSITVPVLGGINPEKSINLGFFNETLAEMYNNPNKPVTSKFAGVADTRLFRNFNLSKLVPPCSGDATWNNLINDLTTLINQIKPEIIVTPHPSLDKHLDHRFSSLAVIEALNKCGLDTGQLFFYVVHPTYSHKYPYGPKHTPVTLPPNLKEFAIPCGVFSWPLTRQQQIEKSFAMDAMTDLREAPDHVCGIRRALKQKIDKLNKRCRHINPWYNYFKKAIRSNELFLTLPYNKSAQIK